jgi:hypothetical protein
MSLNELAENGDWDVVNEQIKRSKIKRVNWKKILGRSLTCAILELKKEGLNSNECFFVLKTGSPIASYINTHFSGKEKLLENLRISVSARYGESKTEEKILFGEDK